VITNTRLLPGALAVAAAALGISACAPSGTVPSADQTPASPRTTMPASAAAATGLAQALGSAAGRKPAAAADSGDSVPAGPGRYRLQPMPAGTVRIERRADGRLQAQFDMFGLTPGSSHQVAVDGPSGQETSFPALTANSAGQADTTVTSPGDVGTLPAHSRLVIRLGGPGGGPLAAEPIAETGALPARHASRGTFSLHAVTSGASGGRLGHPAGRATISYNPDAHTLTVTVTASGLTPGPHAAHIHLGSCQHQGPVEHMLRDFTANTRGDIIRQTRVVTGVTSAPRPGAWYLNLHQGSSSQILANGVPTLLFRPMLCADITNVATSGGGAPPASQPASSPASPVGSPPVSRSSAPPAAAPSPGGTPMPDGVAGDWTFTFNAEFNGTSLDTADWSTGWYGSGITAPVNSSEDDCYDPAQVSEGGGTLNLTVIQKNENCGGQDEQYATGLVSTMGKFSFTYGFVEARVWLPAVPGNPGEVANWPAVWTDGQNWPEDGEDDVAEGLGGQMCAHFHGPENPDGIGADGGSGCASGNYTGGWHTFAADWEPGSITYYYDGVDIGSVTSGITSAPMFIVLDYAVQDSAVAPATMKIAYVRVWQHP
jgi:Glycosyl hydrolases family 16/CHRD domain